MKSEYKRFLVFSYYQYYPQGGLDDVVKSFDTQKEAEDFLQKDNQEFNYVFDRIEGKIVFKNNIWE